MVKQDIKLKEADLYKISSESFTQKKRKLNKRFKNIKNNILKERKEVLDKISNKHEYNVVNHKYKKLLARAQYKYTLLTNAFRNQELYRRGVLESEIASARKKYTLRRKTIVKFDQIAEKEKLNKKISALRKKYSRPISTNYRKNRVSAYANKADISNLKVPSPSPYARYFKIFLMIMLASVLTTLALDIFYKPFGLYNAGLRGITQVFFYIIQKHYPEAPNWYSHALFFGANLPLFVWAWFKIGKKFTLYTFVFIITQYLTSVGFEYSKIFEHIKPLGRTPQQIVDLRQSDNLSELYQYAIVFISAIVASIFYGIGVGFVYRAGGSTGGSKFIVTYWSAKKNRSVGFFASIFGIFVIFFGLTINKLIVDGESILDSYASSTLLASLVFVFLSNYFLDMTFNKSKKIKLQMITKMGGEIQYFLDYYLMYDQSYTVQKIRKGQSGSKKAKIEMILHPLDAIKLKKYFQTIDPGAYIVETEVKKVSGKFFNSWFE